MAEVAGVDAGHPSGSSRLLAAVPALPVSDERRAVRFLSDALGMSELQHEGRGLGICVRDDVEIHVWLADGKAEGAQRHLAGSASCRIRVSAVQGLYDHCQVLGVVHPNAALHDTWWGTREFAVLDPDGNLIAVYERRTDDSAG